MSESKASRGLAAFIALSVFAALALQVAISTDGPPLLAFALLLRFFTIWTNLATGLVMARIALGGRVPAAVLFALATALAIVATVYWLALASTHHPVGLERATNQAFHTIVPLAGIGWWLAFSRGAQGWRNLWPVMVLPVVYTIFALVLGEATGFYAYFFLDKSTLGWGALLVNVAGLAGVFLLVGAILMTIRRSIAGKTMAQAT